MTAILLDTNVLSELVRAKPNARVIAFMDSTPDLLISAMSVQEIAFGVERAPDPARRAKLGAWLANVRRQFHGRVVEIDWAVAESAARIRANAAAQGASHDTIDALIAACALARGVPIATRNVRDFAAFGVDLINPWAA
ncbi:MAG TPA: type II toxin-antitoxin system VapC family toxin [Caulobacterales bacterium]|nr:type II toxin-antitoxin system VapC family toxin [Caulobacterales bacterium]